MLKLTDWRDRGEIYIAPAHIVGIESTSKGSRVIVPGAMFTVCERPSEIMAMPAMVKHQNPMYYVPPAFPGGDAFKSVGEFARAVEYNLRHDGFDPEKTGS